MSKSILNKSNHEYKLQPINDVTGDQWQHYANRKLARFCCKDLFSLDVHFRAHFKACSDVSTKPLVGGWYCGNVAMV